MVPERPVSYDYYTTTQDECGMVGQQYPRQSSASPPQVFSYPPLSTSDAYRPSYGQMPVYHTVPSSYSDISFTDYGEPIPSMKDDSLRTGNLYRWLLESWTG
ncbi:hypothetical protein N7530_012679 [Penicillium desertorum]|uniref:Uncharacterized protein n=1 Tax=Penicillium desertorum TaxID=1303715 RepID=A0A9W9WD59_9EURO|nr:hypothetical protein N7530_012679 [Penicillium desertorum]